MKIIYPLAHSFALTYGEGQYSCGTYDNATQTCAANGGGSSGNNGSSGTGSTGGGTSSGGGALVNTGTAIILFATVACLIIFVTLLVRFWHRPARKPKDGDPTTPASS